MILMFTVDDLEIPDEKRDEDAKETRSVSATPVPHQAAKILYNPPGVTFEAEGRQFLPASWCYRYDQFKNKSDLIQNYILVGDGIRTLDPGVSAKLLFHTIRPPCQLTSKHACSVNCKREIELYCISPHMHFHSTIIKVTDDDDLDSLINRR